MTKWWATLQAREKKMLGFGFIALVVMGGYLFLIEPFMDQSTLLTTRVAAQKNLKTHLERVALEAKSLRSNAGGAIKLSGSGRDTLLAVISKTSRKNGIKEAMKRITPEGSGKARIWLEDASFDQMIAWLMIINGTYGINVENINVSAADEPGLVRAKLTLVATKQ
ncbi:MAG: type II secretion system protein M [Candidatus Polarisedimenticolaceae bacterium]|nr:type II secretion system protein M [Candidatus Polarisedimenticolaceae bacterium]